MISLFLSFFCFIWSIVDFSMNEYQQTRLYEIYLYFSLEHFQKDFFFWGGGKCFSIAHMLLFCSSYRFFRFFPSHFFWETNSSVSTHLSSIIFWDYISLLSFYLEYKVILTPTKLYDINLKYIYYPLLILTVAESFQNDIINCQALIASSSR